MQLDIVVALALAVTFFGVAARPAAAACLLAFLYALGVFLLSAVSGEAGARRAAVAVVATGSLLYLSRVAPAAVGHEALLGAAGGLACLATHRLLVRIPLPPLPPLTGRTVVVTGSSAGLGLATAEQLLERGATVIFACRSEARGRAACRAACSASGAPPERALFLALDLESCASVRAFAAQLLATGGRCDALICNAGAMHPERRVTRDGWEANLACHALGHNLSRPAAAAAYELVDEFSAS
mmetsp:Transcript_6454/g.18571  ORF Transcript_6454/g.18571 Transcript_6454/m.18571 type:complete len:242 (+) Transcript_6454:52-777(+)